MKKKFIAMALLTSMMVVGTGGMLGVTAFADNTVITSNYSTNEVVITMKDLVNAAKESYDSGEISYEEYRRVYIASTFRAAGGGVTKIKNTANGYDVYISGKTLDMLLGVSKGAAVSILENAFKNVTSIYVKIAQVVVGVLIDRSIPQVYKTNGMIISFTFQEMSYYVDFAKFNDIVLVYSGMRVQ